MKFKSEKLVEKIGYLPLILLFLIGRIFDVITTESGLEKGYREHTANFIFYGVANPYLSYVLSGIVAFLIIGICMFGYSYFKKRGDKSNEKNSIINHIFTFIFANAILLFSIMNFIAPINNTLLIIGIFPQIRYDIVFNRVTITIFFFYTIMGIIKIYNAHTSR